MIPVKVHKIAYYPANRSYTVILQEIVGRRILPVVVGAFEAQAIALSLEALKTPRPLTHDLIINIIRGFSSKLVSVSINKIKDGVFFSVLNLEGGLNGRLEIDSRPSDALAIALRLDVPILVGKDVMEEASITENDLTINSVPAPSELKNLETRLAQAVEQENYEIAAKIRDKIKGLNPVK